MHLETEQTWSEEVGLCITTPSPSDCHFCFCSLKLPLLRTEAARLAFSITYLQQL